MNIFLRVRFVGYLISRKYGDFGISRSGAIIGVKIYNDSLSGSSLKVFTLGLPRNFTNHAALLHENRADLGKVKSKKKESHTSKGAKDPIISLIKDDGQESVMKLSEAEKYAKIKNMKLVEVENIRMGKVKYKLESRLNILDKKNKTQGKMRKIILREEIHSHDLEIKINQLLKFIEKDEQVLCSIECSSKGVKLKEIISKIENSQLKDHIISNTETKKNCTLLFRKKPTVKSDKPKGKSESEDNVESSITEN